MSTNTLTSPAATASKAQSAADEVRLTFPRIVRSEWIKFRTLRSTIWTLASMVVVMIGIVTMSSIYGASQANDAGTGQGSGSVSSFFDAAMLAQLAVIVLGVLVISGEYSTGMIRSTLVAVPKRLPALWAKCVVLAAAIFAVSTVSVAISLGVMQLILGGKGLAPDFGESETVRILVGTPLYLTAIALFAFAVGALLRHSAGALTAVLGLLLVIESLFQIPWKPLQMISPFLPGTAGSKLLMPQKLLDSLAQDAVGPVLGPWAGFAVLLVWVAVPLTAAAVLLKKRNA